MQVTHEVLTRYVLWSGAAASTAAGRLMGASMRAGDLRLDELPKI